MGNAPRPGLPGLYRGAVSLRLRLTALFSVLLVVVVATAFAVNLALGRVERNRALVTDQLQPASVEGRSLLVSLVDQETGERGYVLSGDERFLRPYRDGDVAFGRTLAELRRDFRHDDAVAARLTASRRPPVGGARSAPSRRSRPAGPGTRPAPRRWCGPDAARPPSTTCGARWPRCSG